MMRITRIMRIMRIGLTAACCRLTAACCLLTAACCLLTAARCFSATFRTPNFVITNPDPAFARQVGETCERYRRDLAVLWLGKKLPGDWAQPATIAVRDGSASPAGGSTSWAFAGGEAFGWSGTWQGSRMRILDSVAPHEITHMVLASHFRRPVPRWADEGAACSVEHDSEKANWRRSIVKCLKANRGIPFNRLVRFREYPRDFEAFYAHGATAAEYLIQQRGHRVFVQLVEQYFRTGDWNGALASLYEQRDLGQLQIDWLAWVRDGQPRCQYVVAYGGRCRYIPGRGWQCVRGPFANLLGRGGPPRAPPGMPGQRTITITPAGPPIYTPIDAAAETAPASELASPLPPPIQETATPKTCAPATATAACPGLDQIKTELAKLKEAVASRGPVAGPIGPPGKDGRDGKAGLPGPAGRDADPARLADLEARLQALESKTILMRTRAPDGRILEEAEIRLADPQPALDLYLIPQRRSAKEP